jgi:hypothetical protein
MFAIHLRAPNDRNGNPCRCYLIMAGTSGYDMRAIACVNEEHTGPQAIDRAGFRGTARPVPIVLAIPVTRSVVRDFLRSLPNTRKEQLNATRAARLPSSVH